MLILLWYLLTAPTDRLICQLWTEQIDQPGLVAACGEYVAEHSADYVVMVEDGCTTTLDALAACPYQGQHVMVYQPNYSVYLCTVTVNHQGEPLQAEIARDCTTEGMLAWMNGKTVWNGPYTKPTETIPPPVCPLLPIPPGPGFYEQPRSTGDLATAEAYEILSYNLRWYGFFTLSPVDWQNQFDNAILRAAVANNIPARVIKAIIAQESQFWPYAVGPGDEWGLIQISEDGADLALHYSPELYKQICPLALWDCSKPYRTQSTANQKAVMWSLRVFLRLDQYEIRRALQKAHEHIPLYAQILAAYRCYTLAILPGAGWDATIAAYNAGGECIKSGQICPEGLKYLRKVER